MRRTALAIAVLTLGVGPWLAFPAGTFVASPAAVFAMPAATGSSPSAPRPQVAAVGPTGQVFRSSACTCREINVTATNIVKGADVRSGDAKVVNRSITYIGPSFRGDTEVEIDQEAEARSGDAIAGQILSVAGAADGCSRIHVNATNIVEDTDVRSGDATAKNKSLVILDPSIKRGDVDIDVDQDAEAESGTALAGQLVGIAGGGGPCGGVILDAVNRLRDVDVRSGEATMKNSSKIMSCDSPACFDELRHLLRTVDSVKVCEDDGCHAVGVDEFVAQMEDDYANSGLGAGDAELTADEPEPTPGRPEGNVPKQDGGRPPRDPRATPTPTPVMDEPGVSLDGAEENPDL